MSDNLQWHVYVDWAQTGSPTDEGERFLRFESERGRDGLLDVDGEGSIKFARNQVGQLTVVLDNADGRFDPYNTNSPLYPNIQPGRDIQVTVQNGDGGSTYNVFTGRIELPKPSVEDGRRLMTLTCSDGWKQLKEPTSIALIQNDDVGAAMTAILTDVGWPVGWGSSIDDGSETVPALWADEEMAWNALHDLAESDLGMIWIGADGQFNFLSRQTLYSSTPEFVLDEEQVRRNIGFSLPWEMICNKIKVAVNPRTVAASAVLWASPEVFAILPGETVIVSGQYQDANLRPCPASPDAPVANTDYKFNSQADGLGTDMIADLDVAVTLRAASVLYVLTNDNVTTTGYVTVLQVQGTPLALTSKQSVISESPASQTIYGIRRLSLDLRFQQQVLVAKDLAPFLCDWLKNPQPLLMVKLEALPAVQFAYDLIDYLTFTSATLGFSGTFRICKIMHRSLSSMQAIETTWVLEPTPPVADYWELGTAGKGELGETTILGF